MPASVFATPNGMTATAEIDAIATTSTDGLVAKNVTPATSGVPVQMSPRVRQRGTAWDTAASQTVDFFTEVLPVTAATPSGSWMLKSSINGGAVTTVLSIDSAGQMTTPGNLVNGGNFFATPAGQFGWGTGASSRSYTSAPAAGQLNIVNAFSGTEGIGLDVATDAVLKVRTRAQTGYATVDALAFTRSGVVLVSGTAPTISSGFGTSPSIVSSNGSVAFTINVGTGGVASSGVIGLPTAPNGWAVMVTNLSSKSATVSVTLQTATTTTTATIGNFTDIFGAGAWNSGDVLSCIAFPY